MFLAVPTLRLKLPHGHIPPPPLTLHRTSMLRKGRWGGAGGGACAKQEDGLTFLFLGGAWVGGRGGKIGGWAGMVFFQGEGKPGGWACMFGFILYARRVSYSESRLGMNRVWRQKADRDVCQI